MPGWVNPQPPPPALHGLERDVVIGGRAATTAAAVIIIIVVGEVALPTTT